MLDLMTKFRQMGALAIEFARDFGGEYAFPDLHDDGPQFTRRMVGSLKGGSGPGVEDAAAVRTAVVRDPAFLVAPAGMQVFLRAAIRAAGAFGVNELQQFLEIATLGASINSLIVHGSFPWFPLALVPSPQAMKGRAACTFLY